MELTSVTTVITLSITTLNTLYFNLIKHKCDRFYLLIFNTPYYYIKIQSFFFFNF